MNNMDTVYKYMLTHEGISSKEAFNLGITRLSAVIFDLKHKRGLGISYINEKSKNRHGHTTVYRRYKLD